MDYKPSIIDNLSSKEEFLISSDFMFVKEVRISWFLTFSAEKENILDGSKTSLKSIFSFQILMKICFKESNPIKRSNDFSSTIFIVSNFGRFTLGVTLN